MAAYSSDRLFYPDLTFDEEAHSYSVNGRPLISTSALLEHLGIDGFDPRWWVNRMLSKGLSASEVRSMKACGWSPELAVPEDGAFMPWPENWPETYVERVIEIHRNHSANRGKAFHRLIEPVLHGTCSPESVCCSSALLPWFQSWCGAALDSKTGQLLMEPLAVESPMMHPVHNFAGTPDFGAIWKGQGTMIDWKTVDDIGKAKRSKRHGYQLTAYVAMWNHALSRQVFTRAVNVVVAPNGVKKIEWELEQLQEMWLDILGRLEANPLTTSSQGW